MEYYTLSRKYLKDAGMNLREWNSNSPNLNIKAKEDKCAAKNPQTKVLGIKWDATLDTLSLSLDKMINDISQATQQKMSKRSVLSIASKVFDPLGFVEPITVKAKIMIQDIWKQNMTWDQEIRNDLKDQWIKWLDDIKNLSMFKIPRPYFSDNITSKQLHIFCDSSQRAYGAVAYLRGTSGNMTQTSFVIAKTRVAPVDANTSTIGTTSSTVRSQPSDVHHESFTTRRRMRNRLLERLTNCAIVAFIQQKTATIRTHANTQDNANNRDT